MMLTKKDLETLAETRLDDACALLRADRASGAYYLAGYAVELALKACIAKVFQTNVIPDKTYVRDIYTHALNDLVNLAGLGPELKQEQSANPLFAGAWGIASKWNEASRYYLWDALTAANMVAAVGDQQNGVLRWVKRYW